MGIRKYKPTTPGRRGSERGRLRRDHAHGRRRSRWCGRSQDRWPQQSGPHHHPSHRWRPQACLPRHRLPSPRQGRRAGEGRAHRVRPQPHRAHRAAALRRRREALHPGAKPPAQGDRIENGPGADIKPGNNLPLRNIPVGTVIHAIELGPAAVAPRSLDLPASRVQLVAKDGPYAQLRMPSGEIRNVDVRCRATVGEVGNAEQSNINWGKAGRMRWKGKRPTVRGVVMNPVDHPHGGGEGQDLRWPQPGQPVGSARGPHPPSQQGERQAHRSTPSPTGKKR
jgi:large subunit ribosomal protein L2